METVVSISNQTAQINLSKLRAFSINIYSRNLVTIEVEYLQTYIGGNAHNMLKLHWLDLLETYI